MTLKRWKPSEIEFVFLLLSILFIYFTDFCRYFVLNEKYSEKCRSNQKLQTLCDTLQRNEPSAKIESIPSDVVTFIEASEKENIFKWIQFFFWFLNW